jgi:hypothetical protein
MVLSDYDGFNPDSLEIRRNGGVSTLLYGGETVYSKKDDENISWCSGTYYMLTLSKDKLTLEVAEHDNGACGGLGRTRYQKQDVEKLLQEQGKLHKQVMHLMFEDIHDDRQDWKLTCASLDGSEILKIDVNPFCRAGELCNTIASELDLHISAAQMVLPDATLLQDKDKEMPVWQVLGPSPAEAL